MTQTTLEMKRGRLLYLKARNERLGLLISRTTAMIAIYTSDPRSQSDLQSLISEHEAELLNNTCEVSQLEADLSDIVRLQSLGYMQERL